MKRVKVFGIVLVVLLSAAIADARYRKGGRSGLHGTITSVGSQSFVLSVDTKRSAATSSGVTTMKVVCDNNTRFVRGWCLEVHDLAIAKYVAGRPKDLTFTEALIRHGMLDCRTLENRLASTPVASEIRELTQHRIARQFKIG